MSGADLIDKVAVVTGGSRGIGAAVVEELARCGARLAVLDRDPLPGTDDMLTLRCDIADEQSISQAFTAIHERLGPPALLVNNAGVNAYADALTMTQTEWDAFFAVDLRGAWLCTRAALPAMLQAGHGAIVNVSSIHAGLTVPGMFPYAAAKAAVEAMTRNLALDFGGRGVRSNAVAPGWVRTDLVERQLLRSPDPAATRQQILAEQALGRMAEPSEIARVIRFLLSDDASYVNGATIAVDGGLSARVHA